MEIRLGESIIRTYHHHYFPYFIRVFKVFLGSMPFFLVAYLFSPLFTMGTQAVIYTAIVILFIGVWIYVSLIYWLDRLVITNHRIVYMDWKQLFLKKEISAYLKDIEEIISQEKGIIAFIPIFNYGIIRIQTAAHEVDINFIEAPNPDGIKDFIYNQKQQVLLTE